MTLLPSITTFAVGTSILPENMCIMGLLLLILKILIYGLGAAAVIGVVISGIQYMTARDNQTQVANAKKRLVNIAIGLIAWALMWVILNWLIPGGMSLDMSQSYTSVCPDAPISAGNSNNLAWGNNGSSSTNQGSSNGNNSGNSGGSQGSTSHTVNGVTRITYNGKTYAFPLKNATKTNIRAINDLNGTSQFENGWAHGGNTGNMLDLMLYNGPKDPVSNVAVVAMTSGTIQWRAPGRGCNGTLPDGSCNSDPYPSSCATVEIKDDNGGIIDYMHLKADPEGKMPKAGTHVNAGDVIGEVGPGTCTKTVNNTGSGTAPHLHLQFLSGHAFKTGGTELKSVLNALWDVLPAN